MTFLAKATPDEAASSRAIVADPLARQAHGTGEPLTRGAIDQARAHAPPLRIADRRQVAFDAYLRELCDDLAATFGTSNGVALTCTAAGELLPAATAIRLGLVADELITNAFKHAFPVERGPVGRGGRIAVLFTADPDAWRLTVEDSGTGLREGRRAGVGLKIARELIDQLDGELEIPRRVGGTCCIVRVPRS